MSPSRLVSRRRLNSLVLPGLWLWSAVLIAMAQPVPSHPSPAEDATGVPVNPELRWAAGTDTRLLNGGFEGGLSLGWTVQSVGALPVTLLDSPAAVPAPFAGAVSAWVPPTRKVGQVEFVQQVFLPANAESIALSWAAWLQARTAFAGFAELRVEVRDLGNLPLEIVFSTTRFESSVAQRAWRRYWADLTPFRGREVIVALVVDTGSYAGSLEPACGLDDVRLQTWTAEQGEFEVYLSTNTPPGQTDLLGRATDFQWALSGLRTNRRHYWQVIAVQGETRTAGPIWAFTTASAPGSSVSDVVLTPPASPALVGVPASLAFSVLNNIGQTSATARASVELAAIAPGLRPPGMLITEVDPGAPDAVEIVNSSEGDLDLSGWSLQFFSGPFIAIRFTFPSNTVAAPGVPVVVHAGGPTGTYPDFGLPNDWDFRWTGNQGAGVALYDAAVNLVDYFCSGVNGPDAQPSAQPVDVLEWRGPTVSCSGDSDLTWQRFGREDRNDRRDWRMAPRSLRQPNLDLAHPFGDGEGKVPLMHGTMQLTRPVTPTNVVFLAAASNSTLYADIAVTSPARFDTLKSAKLHILPAEPIQLGPGALLQEGDGEVTNALYAQLRTPRSTNVSFTLSAASDEAELSSTGPWVLPAGETNLAVAMSILDDSRFDGTQWVEVTGAAEGFYIAPVSLAVHDNEPGTLTLGLPLDLAEGETRPATVILGSPAGLPVTVTLESSDPEVLLLPATAQVPVGETSVDFNLYAPPDHRWTGPRSVTLRATVSGWTGAEAALIVDDGDEGRLMVLLPDRTFEDAGTLTNAGVVALPYVTNAPVIVTLTSGDATEASTPSAVTIPAGESAARFDLTVLDDVERDGTRAVTITASASDLANGTGIVAVADNDPASFEFGPVASPRIAGEPFDVAILARDVNGEIIAGSAGPVNLWADSSSGPVLLTVVGEVRLSEGSWIGGVAVPISTSGVWLVAELGGAQGRSTSFNVVPNPVAATVALRTLDLGWDPHRERLLASVAPEDAVYGNRIVSLDPTNGTVLGTLSAGPFVSPVGFTLVRDGRLLVDGNTLYVSVQGGSRVQQFNLETDTLLRELALDGPESPGLVGDLATVPGRPGMLLVGQTDGGTGTGLTLFSGGPPRSWSQPGGPATLLVTGPDPGVVFGCVENSPFPWYRFDIDGAGELTVTYYGIGAAAIWPGGAARWLDRSVVFARGDVFQVDTFEFSRPYAVEGMVTTTPGFDDPWGTLEVASDQRRVFFLNQDLATNTTQLLQVFEEGSGAPLRRLQIETGSATARRLVRAGPDTLTFNTPTEVRLLRSSWLLPVYPWTGLTVIQQPTPAQPLAGASFTWSLVVTNTSPVAATDVTLECPMPAGIEFVDATGTAGPGSFTNGVWRLHQLVLPPHGSTVAELRVRALGAGPITNEVRIQANEWNPVSPNGLFRFATPVSAPVLLNLARSADQIVLSWPEGTLQEAPEVSGAYTDVPGATSPFTNAPAGVTRFFRLRVLPGP